MRIVFYLLLCSLFFSTISNAQYPAALEKLLEDKRVVWIGETTYDYQLFDHQMPERGPNAGNAFQILKSYDYPRPIVFDVVSSPFFRWVQPEWLETQDFSFFKDEALSEPLENWESKLIQKQKIETFDVQTYEPIVEIVENRLSEDKLRYLRLRQLLYFDKRKHRYESIPLAIAPVILNESGKHEVLYWIKLPDNFLRNRLPIKRKRFSWAVRSILRDTLLEPTAFRMYKGAKDYSFSDLTQLQLEENPRDLYQFIQNEDPISANLCKNLLTGETQDIEEKNIANLPQALSEQVDALRLVQIWLWDKRSERFQLYLEAVAPIHRLEVSPGVQSSLPLFYQR